MITKWRECLMGDVIELKRGYDLPEQLRRDGSIPIVSSSGKTGYHSEAKVKGPGVVTGRTGTLGEVFYVREDFWPLNTALYVRDFKGNDPRFVSYWLTQHGLARQNSAGAVPGVNRNHLHQLKVRVPDLRSQKRIASVLSSYDDLIENHTQRIKILEKITQRTFDEWFVRFRASDLNVFQLAATVAGHPPEGWEVVTLESVCDRITDGSHYSPPSVLSGRRMASVKDMKNWGFDLSECRMISEQDFDSLVRNDCRPRAGDILVAKDGANLNKHTFLVLEETDLVILSSIAILRPHRDFEREFLVATLKSEGVSRRIKDSRTGAAIPRIILKDFRRLPIILPPKHLRRQYERVVGPLHQLCRVLSSVNQNLRAQRDLLLIRLISGEIDVSRVEHIMQAAE